MSIEISGVEIDRALRARVAARLAHALRRARGGPVVAHATFFDDNGPKGGVDRRCALTVRLPRRRALRVERTAETARLAFDGAFEALNRRIVEILERGRDLRRRPKKYFVARRLMSTSAGQTGREAGATP